MLKKWELLQDTNETTLKSIEENNLIFVSAQPDTVYFHWQVEIYLYQFSKHGIINRCYALFGYITKPSEYGIYLASKYPNIKFYKDERKAQAPETIAYAPTIRPHLLSKFFKEYPELGKNVFYHDSDIFLVKLPKFEYMLDPFDKTTYLSNTISYIGYEYIKTCAKRYKLKHPSLPDDDIFYGMCDVLDIDYELVIKNENNSGGAQYLLKNIDTEFWKECEVKCETLYTYLSNYEKKYPIIKPIQKWTVDMWVILWLYWKKGFRTLIHKELDFSWATSSSDDYKRLNIFHLAGVTDNIASDKFHKGLFIKRSVFDAYIEDPNIFSHIDPNNATYEYVKIIKEYVQKNYMSSKRMKFNSNIKAIKPPSMETNNNIKSFRIISENIYANDYHIDETLFCCNKHVWRSENDLFLIFWNGNEWILTYSAYEEFIGPNCGGIISNTSTVPYSNEWNTSEMIVKLL
jgi:hypothetical protein